LGETCGKPEEVEKEAKLKSFSNRQVEELAENRVLEYSRKYGTITEPPIPIDLIIELLFGLSIGWDEISEDDGLKIFGALRPLKKEIVLNEKHISLFGEIPGLERSTKGHELGHWDLYIDKTSLEYPVFPGFSRSEFFEFRTARKGEVRIIRNALIDEDAYRTVKAYINKVDSPYVATMVNKYASVISMPSFLFLPVARDFNLKRWPSLYKLAELFNVTISALVVRLEQLGLLYVSDNREIYSSRAEFLGQKDLFV
jgi:hypothetical protein